MAAGSKYWKIRLCSRKLSYEIADRVDLGVQSRRGSPSGYFAAVVKVDRGPRETRHTISTVGAS